MEARLGRFWDALEISSGASSEIQQIDWKWFLAARHFVAISRRRYVQIRGLGTHEHVWTMFIPITDSCEPQWIMKHSI